MCDVVIMGIYLHTSFQDEPFLSFSQKASSLSTRESQLKSNIHKMKESHQTAFDQSQQVSKDVENIQSRIDHGIDTLLTNKPSIKEKDKHPFNF